MADKTVHQQTEDTSPTTDDEILMWDVATGTSKKATVSNVVQARSGSVVQKIGNIVSTVGQDATTIPADDTIPQKTEGFQVLSQAITPTSATNIILVEVVVFCSATTAQPITVALFQDTTTNALAAVETYQAQANGMVTIPLHFKMTSGTTSSTTFKVRIGSNGGVVNVNGANAVRRYGGVGTSSIFVTELKA